MQAGNRTTAKNTESPCSFWRDTDWQKQVCERMKNKKAKAGGGGKLFLTIRFRFDCLIYRR